MHDISSSLELKNLMLKERTEQRVAYKNEIGLKFKPKNLHKQKPLKRDKAASRSAGFLSVVKTNANLNLRILI